MESDYLIISCSSLKTTDINVAARIALNFIKLKRLSFNSEVKNGNF